MPDGPVAGLAAAESRRPTRHQGSRAKSAARKRAWRTTASRRRCGFITGTSKGFGRVWAEAALQRGDKVVATARDPKSLDALVGSHGKAVLPLALDVTDASAAFAAVQRGRDEFGRLDVVVNNAGYGLFGMVEEVTPEQARAQMETNFFRRSLVTKAALPILREQRSGHIIQVSSIGGVHAFPMFGLYHASKWTLEGLSQSLAAEVEGFGVKVTLVEPGGFDTEAIALRLVEVFNGRRLDLLEDVLHPEFRGRGISAFPPDGAEVGPGARRKLYEMFYQAIPDARAEVLDVVAEGDKVVLVDRFGGTHRGELFGRPGTGDRIEWMAIHIYTIRDGKILEDAVMTDALAIMQQLGLVPSLTKAAG